MVLCTERSLVKHDAGTLTVTPLRCRCWKCQHCAPIRRRDLLFKAMRGDPRIFLTLTIRKGRYATQEQQAVALATGWRMLRQFLLRHLKRKDLPFIAIIEKHKSGWPHLHLLLRGGYIDHRLIRRWWEHRFNSPQIFIRLAKNKEQSAFYCVKYVAKDPERFEGCKRYWSSKDWELASNARPAPPVPDHVYWTTSMSRPWAMASMALSDGARVLCEGSKLVISGWWEPDRRKWGLE